MIAKCILSILELNWNQRFRGKKTTLKISRQVLTSSTQRQNSSFYVVERTRTVLKRAKMKSARAKRAKLLFFIVKYTNLWRSRRRRRRACLSSLIKFWDRKNEFTGSKGWSRFDAEINFHSLL